MLVVGCASAFSLIGSSYLNPSLLYPDALAYQLASGIIHLLSHGLAKMNGAREGADIVSVAV